MQWTIERAGAAEQAAHVPHRGGVPVVQGGVETTGIREHVAPLEEKSASRRLKHQHPKPYTRNHTEASPYKTKAKTHLQTPKRDLLPPSKSPNSIPRYMLITRRVSHFARGRLKLVAPANIKPRSQFTGLIIIKTWQGNQKLPKP